MLVGREADTQAAPIVAVDDLGDQPVRRQRLRQVAADAPPGDVDLDRLAHCVSEYPC